jgi:hypothetical protein
MENPEIFQPTADYIIAELPSNYSYLLVYSSPDQMHKA